MRNRERSRLPLPFADTHTHILPGIDDGAKSIEESASMLRAFVHGGVQDICLTPHFYPFRQTLHGFLENREDALDKIFPVIKENHINVCLGAEIYLCEQVFAIDDISPAALGGGPMALIELPFRPITAEVIHRLERFADQFDLYPIIAHIERYDLFKNRKLRNRFREIGCSFQMNLGVLRSSFFERKRAISLLKDGEIDFLGSDAHNMNTRPPILFSDLPLSDEVVIEREIHRIYENTTSALAFASLNEAQYVSME